MSRVRMYECMYVCKHMYVCMYVYNYVYMHICAYLCISALSAKGGSTHGGKHRYAWTKHIDMHISILIGTFNDQNEGNNQDRDSLKTGFDYKYM